MLSPASQADAILISKSMRQPLIIGHRGASASAPENTLIAFEKAMVDGADGVEFDVQLARDGVPVVIHDATLKRTGLRSGSIGELTSVELEAIDVGSWFNLCFPKAAHHDFPNANIPTLAKVLDYFKISDAQLYIEMKCAVSESRTLASKVVQLLHEYHLPSRAIVESFTLDSIREIKRLDSKIRTAALFEPKVTRPLRTKHAMVDEALACEADEIAWHRSMVTARGVEEAIRSGLHVIVWTVDHPSWIERAMTYGVHAIITNHPRRMCAKREEFVNAQSSRHS